MILAGLEGFLFDLDGVLVDSRAAVERHWRVFAGWFDLPAEAVLAGAHGRRSRDVIARMLGARHVDEALERFEALEVEDVDGVVGLPGAAALLESLPPTSWALVTSASSALARSRLRAASLPGPAATISAEDVTEGKPDPAGFALGAARLGAQPTRCAGFEDSPPGLVASLGAGLVTIALTTTHTRDELTAAAGRLDLVVADLSAVTVRRGDRLALELRLSA
jgi:sugar-phosphatase